MYMGEILLNGPAIICFVLLHAWLKNGHSHNQMNMKWSEHCDSVLDMKNVSNKIVI